MRHYGEKHITFRYRCGEKVGFVACTPEVGGEQGGQGPHTDCQRGRQFRRRGGVSAGFCGAGIDACGGRYVVRLKNMMMVDGRDVEQELVVDGAKMTREAEEGDEQGGEAA